MRTRILEVIKCAWHSENAFVFYTAKNTFSFGSVKKFRYNWTGLDLKLEWRNVTIQETKSKYLVLRIQTQIDNETFCSTVVDQQKSYGVRSRMLENALHDLKNELLSISLGIETIRASKRRDLVFKLFDQLN